jgi:hypothetical protein
VIVCRIKTMGLVDDARVLTEKIVVAPSIGAALDAHAPDPAGGATFVVEVFLSDTMVVT